MNATVTPEVKKVVSHFISTEDPFFKQFGITNDAKTPIARAYVSAYVQCWTRKNEGYADSATINRKSLYAFFNSDEYLADCIAHGVTTGSKIGERASLDPKWGDAPVAWKKANAARKTVATPPVVQQPAAPVASATDDPEAAAFAATGLVVEAKQLIAEPTSVPAVVEATVSSKEARKAARQRVADEAQRIMA